MYTLLGEFKPRALLCRLFGHWWALVWDDSTWRYCRNCDVVNIPQQ